MAREHVNHASTINRQVRPLDETDDDNKHFGAHAGVYLPGPAATVNRTTGAAMLADTTIRTRIGCRIGKCANDINGPAADPRDHYLHAKAYEVAQLIGTPPPWRANAEHGRLDRALMLRELINAGHIPPAPTCSRRAPCEVSSRASTTNSVSAPDTSHNTVYRCT